MYKNPINNKNIEKVFKHKKYVNVFIIIHYFICK